MGVAEVASAFQAARTAELAERFGTRSQIPDVARDVIVTDVITPDQPVASPAF